MVAPPPHMRIWWKGGNWASVFKEKKTVKSMYEKMGLKKHTDEWIIMLLFFSLDLVSYFILDFFFFFNREGWAGVLTFARLSGHLLFLLKAQWGWGKTPRHGSIQTLFLRPLRPSASLSPVTNRRGWREQQGKSQSQHLNKISTCPSP